MDKSIETKIRKMLKDLNIYTMLVDEEPKGMSKAKARKVIAERREDFNREWGQMHGYLDALRDAGIADLRCEYLPWQIKDKHPAHKFAVWDRSTRSVILDFQEERWQMPENPLDRCESAA